jgi:hypothetical protein
VLQLLTAGAIAGDDVSYELTPPDSLALETLGAISWFFQQSGDEVWPGYDLTRQPYLVYSPNRWAVLLNGDVLGFSAYPSDWPPLGAPARILYGRVPRLAGQLAFDVRLDETKTVAIPLSAVAGDRQAAIGNGFAFIVHEAFHQFQHEGFISLPDDQPEEEYPILDSENTALASLEMRVLMDAIRATGSGDTVAVRGFAEEFIAVRQARWRRDAVFRIYELPQECVEGTAKYVEVRAIGGMGERCRGAADASIPGWDVFAPIRVTDYLLADFEDRWVNGVLPPQSMARNRVYPTGAALALLLDFYDIDWKSQASDAANSPGLCEFLGQFLNVPNERRSELLARAQTRYDFSAMLAECKRVSAEYPSVYQAAVDSLAQLPGLYFSIDTPISGLARSRSCRGRRLTLEHPARVFSEHCQIYSLRRNVGGNIVVEINDAAVVEETSGDGARRTVQFHVPGIPEVEVDQQPVNLSGDGEYPFKRLFISGEGLKIHGECEGALAVKGTRVSIALSPGNP